ncbi:MAG: hypothetical protein DRJ31_03000 [Candidatus Methanomethylicota archaeon]|uniref:Thaumarchaeal output domain-containing protein n=1 Tax=Thermoproteota archaeon TaxID=2056631 RepID=A0A497ERE1_9CREN|nr:MAG: hypothetical protein DRJ31_03000 [Candidatus Verstraetearchaeota archaeon]
MAGSIPLDELRKDTKLTKLVSALMSKGVSRIDPEISCEGFSYRIVEDSLALTPEQAKDLLDQYVDLRAFTKYVKDQLLRCPNCNSYFIQGRFRCPFCNSINLEKSYLIEHYACGTLRRKEDFERDGKLVCPICGGELKTEGVDYRYAGAWFTCRDCKKQFNMPSVRFVCRRCNMELSIDKIELTILNSYAAEDVAVKMVSKETIVVAPLVNFLRSLGLTVSSPGTLVGKSGVHHIFDLIIEIRSEGTSAPLAVDVSKSLEGASEFDVIAMFAKVVDAGVKIPVLVAMPKMSDMGKKLAASYGINVIEGTSLDELFEKFRSLLKDKVKL